MRLVDALRLARTLLDMGFSIEEAVASTHIPGELREEVQRKLMDERILVIKDATMVQDPERQHVDWLPGVDRANWFYWPRLRRYLIDRKGWAEPSVRSVDNASDRILAALENPVSATPFNTRGLVVGYVQSGKTTNYTALIAKSVDCGYRLVIVLTGTHNNLRLQTQRRLDEELVGQVGSTYVGVGMMEPIPSAREWLTFTKPDLDGDFNAGNANATALGRDIPILLVVKKNAPVLSRLTAWLDSTQDESRRQTPCLIVDDEADLASVNTRGNRAPVDAGVDDEDDEDATSPEDREDIAPSRINEQIRSLLRRFDRVAYVAYTATPFANVLIDHTAVDNVAGDDLYPRSFIVALPRPHGYFGAERIFGTVDDPSGGMDVIRSVPEREVPDLVPRRRSDQYGFEPSMPASLKMAIYDFVLGAAARAQRGDGNEPATMLLHGSFFRMVQHPVTVMVAREAEQLRDEWRYFRDKGLVQRLEMRWEQDFRRVIRSQSPELDVSFDAVAPFIGPFLEQLQVRQLNYGSPDEVDYEKDPSLKVIVVGGNKLSRGLTLEGLLISYFVRRANTYDTLMQMGRWFGFRDRYADLTRIYTTPRLEGLFRDLATVEEELRADIARYEEERLTPLEVGVRIRRHPTMMVTSRLKMRSATEIQVSLAGQLLQTITFPFQEPSWFAHNIDVTRAFCQRLGPPTNWERGLPTWHSVPVDNILEYMSSYRTDPGATRVNSKLIREYIQNQVASDELTNWIVGVMERPKHDASLGTMDLGIVGYEVGLIERTRLVGLNSLKVITSPIDQEIGLSASERERLAALKEGSNVPYPRLIRQVRNPRQGVLLIYPISKYSGLRTHTDGRCQLFDEPDSADDVIGLAWIFPESSSAGTVTYFVGTVGTGNT